MGIETIISNQYLWLFVGSLFGVSFNVLIFLEKIRDKITHIEGNIVNKLKTKYKNNNLNVNDVILVYNNLSKDKSLFRNINYYLEVNLWSGISFPIGCLIGFFSEMIGFSDVLALIIIITSGLIFSISFIILIIYYIRNLKKIN